MAADKVAQRPAYALLERAVAVDDDALEIADDRDVRGHLEHAHGIEAVQVGRVRGPRAVHDSVIGSESSALSRAHGCRSYTSRNVASTLSTTCGSCGKAICSRFLA